MSFPDIYKSLENDSLNLYFFKQVEKHLLQEEKDKDDEILLHSLEKYFVQYIILTSLNDCIQTSIREKSNLMSSNQNDFDIEPFYTKQIQKYLPEEDSSKESHIFEINQTFVSNYFRDKIEKSYEDYTRSVKKKIKDFCLKILEFFHQLQGVPFPKKSTRKFWDDLFINTFQTLSSKSAMLNPKRTELHPMNASLQEMKGTYYTLLTKELSLLQELMEFWKQRCNYRLSYANFITEKESALGLKLKMFQLEILLRTYDKESVAALKLIKSGLEERVSEATTARDNLQRNLRAYNILGPSYEKLVEQYIALQEKVKNQEWTIHYMTEQKEKLEKKNEDGH